MFFSDLGNEIKPVDGTNRKFNGVEVTNEGIIVNGDLHLKYFDFWDSLLETYDDEMNVNLSTTVNGQLFKQFEKIQQYATNDTSIIYHQKLESTLTTQAQHEGTVDRSEI